MTMSFYMTTSDYVTSDMTHRPSRWQSQVLAGFTQLWEHYGEHLYIGRYKSGIKIPPHMTILGMYLKLIHLHIRDISENFHAELRSKSFITF